ncbi:hypothetical protein ACQPYK_09690 [Streptosporangium sp. CA-135522]|uniref:hypothetical protein n=1 Tax=Streptosporangium sp. CA-135522 TaxID=3240072 RepID=UPI003D94E348
MGTVTGFYFGSGFEELLFQDLGTATRDWPGLTPLTRPRSPDRTHRNGAGENRRRFAVSAPAAQSEQAAASGLGAQAVQDDGDETLGEPA